MWTESDVVLRPVVPPVNASETDSVGSGTRREKKRQTLNLEKKNRNDDSVILGESAVILSRNVSPTGMHFSS